MSAANPNPAVAPNAAPRPYMGFVTDEVTRTNLERAAEQTGFEGEVFVGDLNGAAQALAEVTTPPYLVIDLSGESDPVEAANRFADVCEPGTRVVVLGGVNDVSVYRDLMSLGIEDYLVKPLSSAQLTRAFSDLAERAEDAAQSRMSEAETGQAEVIGVVSARGGAGATMVAVNLAAMLSREAMGRTVLVDLDLRFGTTAVMLDVEPGRGLREALDNPGRMDDLFLERAAVRLNDNLYLMAGEEDIGHAIDARPEALETLFSMLRKSFDHVVVDLPRWRAADYVRHLDRVLMVTEPTLVGMRDGLRLKDAMTAAKGLAGGGDLNLLIALNRGGAADRGMLKSADMTAGGLPKPDYILPAEHKAQAQAQAVGQPLIEAAPRAKAVKVFAAMARDLALKDEADDAGGNRSVLGRLLGRRK